MDKFSIHTISEGDKKRGLNRGGLSQNMAGLRVWQKRLAPKFLNLLGALKLLCTCIYIALCRSIKIHSYIIKAQYL